MRHIISGILSLTQHYEEMKNNYERFRPDRCPECGRSGLWCHGNYGRKADYDNCGSDSLNPVPIPRFYCSGCHSTCSALPECIPPRRHYPWLIQQAVLLLLISGNSHNEISQQKKVPSPNYREIDGDTESGSLLFNTLENTERLFPSNLEKTQKKPSRWTIGRWYRQLKSQFLMHADHLRSVRAELGRTSDFISFWSVVMDTFSLSGAMLNLNNAGIIIP